MAERNAWVLAQRGPRNAVTPDRPYAFTVEPERNAEGLIVSIATIFLTNKECPFRCVMCDLWQNTLEQKLAIGHLPRQIDYALSRLPVSREIKLYNSGSFFDPAAIPPGDYEEIAKRLRGFDRIIVECHPAFLGDRCMRFRDLSSGQLEVAIGLETVHEPALEKLNKGMGLKQFEQASAFLKREAVALRVFLLIQPPFLDPGESRHWLRHSVRFALEHGATAISLIPTRAGNGAMEKLQEDGAYIAPTLSTIEDSLDDAIGLQQCRVFADLWDLQKFSTCPVCFPARLERLEQTNLSQTVLPRIPCHCSSDDALTFGGKHLRPAEMKAESPQPSQG